MMITWSEKLDYTSAEGVFWPLITPIVYDPAE